MLRKNNDLCTFNTNLQKANTTSCNGVRSQREQSPTGAFYNLALLGAGGGGVGPGAAFTNTKHSAVFVLHNLCLKESWLLLLGCACDFSL